MTSHSRTITIGDMHGCSLALKTLLKEIRPTPDDLIVTLGDYVDRGPDSRGVLDELIRLKSQCRLISILGNHDDMFLQVLKGLHTIDLLIGMGGLATLESYGAGKPPDLGVVPAAHVDFLSSCVSYFETETHIFLHASYVPHCPMPEQPVLALRWESLRCGIPEPHFSGKKVIVGHTRQKKGEVLELGHITCIDTYCYGGGWLTALDVHSGKVWQASRKGKVRNKGS